MVLRGFCQEKNKANITVYSSWLVVRSKDKENEVEKTKFILSSVEWANFTLKTLGKEQLEESRCQTNDTNNGMLFIAKDLTAVRQ